MSPDIRIRPYSTDDAEEVWQAATESSAELLPWMSRYHVGYHIRETRSWLEMQVTAFRLGNAYEFAIVSREGRYLGGCGLSRIDPLNRLANLGYWVRTSATRRGIARTAVTQVAAWAYEHTDLMRFGDYRRHGEPRQSAGGRACGGPARRRVALAPLRPRTVSGRRRLLHFAIRTWGTKALRAFTKFTKKAPEGDRAVARERVCRSDALAQTCSEITGRSGSNDRPSSARRASASAPRFPADTYSKSSVFASQLRLKAVVNGWVKAPGSSIIRSYLIVRESERVNRSTVCSASVCGVPRRSIQKLSLKPTVSTTRVSPSHQPTESP